LPQHRASSVHALARALSFLGDRCHRCSYALPQLLENFCLRPELGRDRELHLDDRGHDAIAPKEMSRTVCAQAPSRQ
jgi:hypothetical protein